MSDKDEINRIRNAAISATIGKPEDGAGISDFIEIDGIAHIVRGRAIFTFKLADQIDPARTNIQIPNVDQKVFNYGSENEIVSKTLLTAKKLFDTKKLGTSFDHQKSLSITAINVCAHDRCGKPHLRCVVHLTKVVRAKNDRPVPDDIQ